MAKPITTSEMREWVEATWNKCQNEVKQEWQGLTRQEFLAATKGLEDLEDCWMAIESALKSKNNVLP